MVRIPPESYLNCVLFYLCALGWVDCGVSASADWGTAETVLGQGRLHLLKNSRFPWGLNSNQFCAFSLISSFKWKFIYVCESCFHFIDNFLCFSDNFLHLSNNFLQFPENFLQCANKFLQLSHNFLQLSHNFVQLSHNFLQLSHTFFRLPHKFLHHPINSFNFTC